MCKFSGCGNEAKSLGLCKSHYMQHRRGKPLKPLRIVNDPIARFWTKVEKTENHWWWSPGARDEHGYGQFSIGIKKIYPHRFSFEIHNGEIPAGLEIDHICRTKLCVNPEHLRAVTRLVNMANRDDNFKIINGVLHCHKNHQIVGDNEYIRPNGRRECRVCINRSKRKKVASGDC